MLSRLLDIKVHQIFCISFLIGLLSSPLFLLFVFPVWVYLRLNKLYPHRRTRIVWVHTILLANFWVFIVGGSVAWILGMFIPR